MMEATELTTTIWHQPTKHAASAAIPVVMPVGPYHDPVPSLAASIRTSRQGPSLIHIIVLNGSSAPAQRGASIAERVGELTDSFALLEVTADIGYVQAVSLGLQAISTLDFINDRVGFLDADSHLGDPQHWSIASRALDDDPELDAISGLVVHESCETWEVLSSARFVDAMAAALGQPLDKPYIQGGAGGTLARRNAFENAIAAALAMGTLIGPTLSATAIAGGRGVRATGRLPCGHTRRRTLEAWFESVRTYERSWRRLVRVNGREIEIPWSGFLERVNLALSEDSALLAEIAENQRLRRRVASAVENEIFAERDGEISNAYTESRAHAAVGEVR